MVRFGYDVGLCAKPSEARVFSMPGQAGRAFYACEGFYALDVASMVDTRRVAEA